MNQRFTPEQLDQVVAEVQRLSEWQQANLDREQVQGILQELNLPAELLDPALVQMQRRQALAAQERRNRWIVLGVISAVILVLGGFTWMAWQKTHTLEQVTAQRDRLTLAQDTGSSLNTVSRQTSGELVYRITLANAPVGQRLDLACNWRDPSGKIVHQNRYQTQDITTPVWNTVCRYPMDASAAPGQWSVEARLGDRQLSEATFEVK
jgi:hypothetical protein